MKYRHFSAALALAVIIGWLPATIAVAETEVAPSSSINTTPSNEVKNDEENANKIKNDSETVEKTDTTGEKTELKDENKETLENPNANSAEYHSLTSGHVDIFEGRPVGEKGIGIAVGDDTEAGKNGAGRVYRTPESVLLDVMPDAWTPLSKQGAFSEITKSDIAYLPLSNDNSGLLWPGWDMQKVNNRFKAVDVVFDRVQTPKDGQIILATNDPALNSGSYVPLLFDGKNQNKPTFHVKSGVYIHSAPPSHTHAIWAFTKPGIYRFYVHLRAQGKTVPDSGPRECTRTAIYTWRVFGKDGTLPVVEGLVDQGPTFVDQSCPLAEPKDNANGTLRAPNLKEIATTKINQTSVQAGKTAGAGNSAGNNAGEASSAGGAGGVGTGNDSSTGKVQCLRQPVSGNGGGNAAQGSHTIPYNTHVHPRWIFTAAGQYKVVIRQSVTLPNGKTVSAPTTLTFNVGGTGNANSGHFDLGAVINNGQLQPMVKDDRVAPGKDVNPTSLIFGLGAAAKTTIPKGMEFIGPAGSTVWQIPEVQENNVPWLGANTMSLGSQAPKGAIWTLESVSGPGKMVVFTSSGSFGGKPNIWFQSGGGSAGGGQKYEWRTPDGQPCTPSAADLARTGNSPMILGISALAFGITVLGGGMLFTRKILSPQTS